MCLQGLSIKQIDSMIELFLSLFQLIMLVNGQPFNVSAIRNVGLRRLRADAGNCTLLTEFRPVGYPHSRYTWHLLYHGFFCHGICCFPTGSFAFYMQVFLFRIRKRHYL
jgi:hypothetical protein